jgi:hypothetical protein
VGGAVDWGSRLALITTAGEYPPADFQNALSYIPENLKLKTDSYGHLKIDTVQNDTRFFQVLLLAFGRRDMKIKKQYSIVQ